MLSKKSLAQLSQCLNSLGYKQKSLCIVREATRKIDLKKFCSVFSKSKIFILKSSPIATLGFNVPPMW